MNVDKIADQRKKRIEKYFKKTPSSREHTIAMVLLGAGGLSGLFGLILIAGGNGVGVLFLAAAVYAAYKGGRRKLDYDKRYRAAEPKPSDDEMDRLLAKDLSGLLERAMRRLGVTLDELELSGERWDPIAHLNRGTPLLDSEQKQPLLVFGPRILAAESAVGQDGVFRFSAYQAMVICPTGYRLGLYSCVIDFLTGGLRQEETQEYHYSDVVAVSTTTTPDSKPFQPVDVRDDSEENVHFARTLLREFQIVVSSGDRSTIVVGIADEDHPNNQATLQRSGIDEVIGSVRRMLREKKGGAPSLS